MDKLIGSSLLKSSWGEWPIAAKWFHSENKGKSKTMKYLKRLSAVTFITLKCNTVPFNICVDTCTYTETYTYAQTHS